MSAASSWAGTMTTTRVRGAAATGGRRDRQAASDSKRRYAERSSAAAPAMPIITVRAAPAATAAVTNGWSIESSVRRAPRRAPPRRTSPGGAGIGHTEVVTTGATNGRAAAIGALAYATNHVVNRVPSHRLRERWYARVL